MYMTSTFGNITRAILAVLALVAVSGCSTLTVGRDFKYADFEAKAKQGVTTTTEVQEWLGPPFGVGVVLEATGERLDQWTYYYGSGKLPSGKDVNFKMLQIKFSPEGKLLSYNWSGDIKPAAPVEKL
jgi:hypothetical protein